MGLIDSTTSRRMTRIGLGLFFLVFGLLKFTAAKWFIEGPYQGFYGISFPTALLYAIGLIQISVSIFFFWDKYTIIAGWIGSGMMLSTIIATLPKILSTFQLPPAAAPPGFLFFAAIPIFFMTLSEALRKESPQESSSPSVRVVEEPKPAEEHNEEGKSPQSYSEAETELVEKETTTI